MISEALRHEMQDRLGWKVAEDPLGRKARDVMLHCSLLACPPLINVPAQSLV